jgi:polar amino acid transport system substrate-binding protein
MRRPRPDGRVIYQERASIMFTRSAMSAVVCVLAFRAVADPLPPQIPVGIYPSYPPLDMRDPSTGALSGFDIELGQQLAKRLGTRFDMQETAFAQLVASVQTGRIRLFFNGMNDTAPRRELISFVDYLRSGTQFMVRAADAGAIASEDDLCGKKIAGSRGTNLPGQIAEWSKTHCETSGKPAVVYLGADNNLDARSQLKQGRADAMAQDSLTIPFAQIQEQGVYRTVGEPFDMTVMGIGVTKSDLALQAALASALQAMIDDGEYAAMLGKWNLPATSAISRVTVNGAVQGQSP